MRRSCGREDGGWGGGGWSWFPCRRRSGASGGPDVHQTRNRGKRRLARARPPARLPPGSHRGHRVAQSWQDTRRLTAGPATAQHRGRVKTLPRGDAWTSKTRSEWSQEITKRADDLVALRRDFHRHPELSHQERRTAEIIADRLHAAKLDVRTGVGGTGVVGVLHGDRPGPTIAWRADIDALPPPELLEAPFTSGTPGAMHACGHDRHTAIPIPTADLLAGEVRAQDTAVLTVGQIVSGTKGNIIPDRAIMRGTIRAFEQSVRDHLVTRLGAFASDIAKAYRAEATTRFDGGSCPAVVNHAKETEFVRACAVDEVGGEAVNEGRVGIVKVEIGHFLCDQPGWYVVV